MMRTVRIAVGAVSGLCLLGAAGVVAMTPQALIVSVLSGAVGLLAFAIGLLPLAPKVRVGGFGILGILGIGVAVLGLIQNVALGALFILLGGLIAIFGGALLPLIMKHV